MDKLLKNLLKNTPLALVVIGAFLLVVGASGGFEKYGFKIDKVAWQISLAVMGAVVALFGGFLLWRGESEEHTSQLAKGWNLKITSHKNGDQVDQHIELRGTYVGKPPRDAISILEQSTVTKHWYFRKPPLIDEKSGQWFTDFHLAGVAGQKRILYLAVLGKAGRVLQKYFFMVEGQTKGATWLEDSWLEELSSNTITLLDQVIVHRKSQQ